MFLNGPSVTQPPPVAPGTANGPVSGAAGAPLPPNPVFASQSGEASRSAESSVQSQYLCFCYSFAESAAERGRLRLRAGVPALVAQRLLVHGDIVPVPCQEVALCGVSFLAWTDAGGRTTKWIWNVRWICTPWKSSKRLTAFGTARAGTDCRHFTAAM